MRKSVWAGPHGDGGNEDEECGGRRASGWRGALYFVYFVFSQRRGSIWRLSESWGRKRAGEEGAVRRNRGAYGWI
jgi:hypothetical protein